VASRAHVDDQRTTPPFVHAPYRARARILITRWLEALSRRVVIESHCNKGGTHALAQQSGWLRSEEEDEPAVQILLRHKAEVGGMQPQEASKQTQRANQSCRVVCGIHHKEQCGRASSMRQNIGEGTRVHELAAAAKHQGALGGRS